MIVFESTSVGVVALVGCLAFFYFLWWVVVRQGKAIASFSSSLGRSIRRAIVTNPDVKKLVASHPHLFGWLARRISIKSFTGLPLTLLVLAFVYTLGLFFGLIEDFLTSDPIIAVDTRLDNLLYAFRNPHLVRLWLWITLLGKWQIFIAFALVATLIWWLRHRREYIGPLWLAIAGSQLMALIGKLLLHRPRPTGLVPVYTEHSFSFPSGHATIAVVLYGFLTYYLMRNSGKWKAKTNTLFIGLASILAIGFSRLYLGVHFLSDVISGYLAGLLWLIIAISMVEWRRSRGRGDRDISLPTFQQRVVGWALILIALAWYIGSAWVYTPLPNEAIPNTEPLVVAPSTLIDTLIANHLPTFTETLTANPQEPLSFIILAADDQQFVAAFERAGWHLADPVNLSSLARIAKAAIFKYSYPTAPMTPSFWNSQVHEFGFEKSTDSNLVSQRHHARFWRTNLRTTGGQRVYVGTASFDTSLKWLVTHRIQPDIDTERDRLLADLRSAGVVADYQQQQFVPPTLGTNFLGDEFFTDGKMYIIILAESKK